jgi:hypothetical protein
MRKWMPPINAEMSRRRLREPKLSNLYRSLGEIAEGSEIFNSQ